jgi:hypothetical protein
VASQIRLDAVTVEASFERVLGEKIVRVTEWKLAR